MPLFVCTIANCNTIDNSALAPKYWTAVVLRAKGDSNGDVLCTACATGEWHDRFPRRRYDRQKDGPIGAGRRLISHGIGEQR